MVEFKSSKPNKDVREIRESRDRDNVDSVDTDFINDVLGADMSDTLKIMKDSHFEHTTKPDVSVLDSVNVTINKSQDVRIKVHDLDKDKDKEGLKRKPSWSML